MTRSTRTALFDRPACQAHDVIGCQVVKCKAIALGVSVEQYHTLVTRPVQRTIAAQRKRAAQIREITHNYID